MWIRCKCGNIIHDVTDCVSYKGHIISDKDYLKMLDLADEMIESPESNREALAMTFRTNMNSYIRIKDIFQCKQCGRILIEDENNHFCSFTLDEHDNKEMLDFDGNETIDYRFMNKF